MYQIFALGVAVLGLAINSHNSRADTLAQKTSTNTSTWDHPKCSLRVSGQDTKAHMFEYSGGSNVSIEAYGGEDHCDLSILAVGGGGSGGCASLGGGGSGYINYMKMSFDIPMANIHVEKLYVHLAIGGVGQATNFTIDGIPWIIGHSLHYSAKPGLFPDE